MKNEKITTLSIHHLQPNPLQPRGSVSAESLEELAQSIREHGILEPLVIAHTPAGYQIIAGERRWRAAKIAGLAVVPVIIRETSPKGMLEMALVENVQRTDLNPIERAKAFQRLSEEFGLAVGEISKRIGKSPPFISNTIRLMTLPDAVKDGLISGLISEGHARALAGISDVREMIEAYKTLLKESGTVRRAEDLARRYREKIDKFAPPFVQLPPIIASEELDRLEDELRAVVHRTIQHARVKLTRSRVETKLVIALKGDPETTEPTLKKIIEKLIEMPA